MLFKHVEVAFRLTNMFDKHVEVAFRLTNMFDKPLRAFNPPLDYLNLAGMKLDTRYCVLLCCYLNFV